MAEIFTSVISSRNISMFIFEEVSRFIEMSPERYFSFTYLSFT